ncbi:MAG: hypothetical protein ACRCTE_07210 [Cellulosilyticaceae bacterium]
MVTFHPNGYCREEALRRLIALKQKGAIKFILMRCNDHLENIRELAIEEVEQMIGTKRKEEIVSCKEWIQHMPLYHKVHTDELYTKLSNEIQILNIKYNIDNNKC